MSDESPLALVTGASRRVGRAIAVELGRCGFELILTYHRGTQAIEETIDLVQQSSAAPVNAVQLNLDDPLCVSRVVEVLRDRTRLDALVHNASSYRRSPLGSITAVDALEQYRVNALSPLLITQALADRLGASVLPGGGAVVCLGDIHVLGRPLPAYAAYAMSKAALTQMVQSLVRDLAPSVRINAVAPGVVAWPQNEDPKVIAAYEARIPLQRPGTPEEAAEVVRWLILEARYVTGEVIRLDGGRWLA